MQTTDKKYWKGLDEIQNTADFQDKASKEFSEKLPLEEIAGGMELSGNRRDFLKISGFSLAAAAIAACNRAPMKKAVPFLNHPEEMSPGIPNYYASSYFDGDEYCSVLVKTREGRPIKIDGNNLSPFTKGATSARVQASVLNLYDQARLRRPMKGDSKISWEKAMEEIMAGLESIKSKGGRSAILTGSIISPSFKGLLNELCASSGLEHVVYDEVSHSGAVQANKELFGVAALPLCNFGQADVIVSISSDFLGTGINATANAKAYSEGRKLNKGQSNMSRHIQFESMLSLTGSNADSRYACTPSQEAVIVANLYNEVAKLNGASTVSAGDIGALGNQVKNAAKDLTRAKGKALVISDIDSKDVQLLVAGINQILGSYGATITDGKYLLIKQGDADKSDALFKDLASGAVSGLIAIDVNPAYTHCNGDAIAKAIEGLELSAFLCDREDESSSKAQYNLPLSNWLESWGDAEVVTGSYSLRQPAITPLFDSKQAEELVMALSENSTSYHDHLKSTWNSEMFAKQSKHMMFDLFWRQVLHDGIFETKAESTSATTSSVSFADCASNIAAAGSGDELILYRKNSIGSGRDANNPWLQEMPDPVTRACWDNYLVMSPNKAVPEGYKDGDIVILRANNTEIEVPVLVLPGLHTNTLALSLGYGRKKAGMVANGVGVNAYPLSSNGMMVGSASISKTGKTVLLAQTQTHHTVEGRDVLKETTLAEFVEGRNAGDPAIYNKRPELVVRGDDNEWTKVHPTDISLFTWQEKKYNGHHWQMSVDLSSCIGCGACVVSCQAENNVSVVGKKEVLNRREMHWIRIDRYFSFKEKNGGDRVTRETEYGGERYDGHPDGLDFRYTDNHVDDFSDVEVTFQPIMCQQCDNAPCETVCPVVATTHSDEGLNQMVYNRCVGTRYCANNCPYKVRRFNWFSYEDNFRFEYINPAQEDLGRMVLNPDVTVRARGVMEKCTFCVQRIQASKLDAKKNQGRVDDKSLQTACSQICPTNAIVFGDANDTESEIYQLIKGEERDSRAYGLVEEINTLPSVHYMVKVRNKEA